jgi:hypothetical protein
MAGPNRALLYQAILNIALPAGQWIAIVSPIACNHYYVIGNSDDSPMSRGSDPDNASTQYVMPSGVGYLLGVPWPAGKYRPRFNAGETVTFLMSAGGTTATVEFTL